MADDLLWSYLSLNDVERTKFDRKYWMVNPNNELSTPNINYFVETASGNIFHENGKFYLRNSRYGIQSTGCYNHMWKLDRSSEHERKKQVVLFELKCSPRYSDNKTICDFDNKQHYYEFIDDVIRTFETETKITDFKQNSHGYYAETKNEYILLPSLIGVLKTTNEDIDPYTAE